MKIAIDNGHGFKTPGKRTPLFSDGSHIREWEFNYPTAHKLGEILQYNGFDVLYVSPDEEDTPLSVRVKRANDAKADLFVSIHYNAGSNPPVWGNYNGIETYYCPGSSNGRKLAELVQKELIAATGRRNRGVKSVGFQVLRETEMPAILIECGFMDNLEEANLMLDEDYQLKCAEAIAKGVCIYFGTNYKEPVQNISNRTWQEAQGINDLYDLVKKGIIQNSEYWEKTILDPMPTWAVLSLINRIASNK